MKRLFYFISLILVSGILGLQSQEPPLAQIWPTTNSPAKYDYYYQSQPWVAINPFNPQIIFVYASGKLLKSIDGGQSWKEIGKGLLDRASFPGIEDMYATRLTFSPFDPSGNTLLLGTNREGVSGVPFLSIDGGESWQPINICEKGPGLSNLTSRFTDSVTAVFSNLNPDYVFLPSFGQADGQPVFLGNLDYGTNKMTIFQNPMFPSGTDSCPSTSLQLKCPNLGNQQGCWQYSDNPWYWGGDVHITVLPNSSDYFETDIHGTFYDCGNYPVCHVTTKMKVFDPETKLQCIVDNVYFDTSYFGTLCTDEHSQHNPKWHFLSPVYYSGEGLTFYTLLAKAQEYGRYEDPLDNCYFPYAVLGRCDGPDTNGDWVFSVVENGQLPEGYGGPSRQIKKRGDWLFILSATPSYNKGTLLAYNIVSHNWVVLDGVVTFDFEIVDIGEGNIGIYYINLYKGSQDVYHTELKMVTFNMGTAQWTNQLIYDFTGLFTGLSAYRVFNDGYVYTDHHGNKNLQIINDDFAVYYSGDTFQTFRGNGKGGFFSKNGCWIELGYSNSSFKLCTANFTSTAVKSVGDEIWGYLSSDAGVWRNKKLDITPTSSEELALAFEQISGGYGTNTEGQIPSEDFGNYCYEVVLDPRDTTQRTLYSACKSGLWKGVEDENGDSVYWDKVFDPQDKQFPDGGVKDVLISDCFVFALTKEGIWRSANDVDWDLIYDANLYGGPVTAISSFEDAPNKIVWFVGSSLYEGSGEGKIYISENAGDDYYSLITLSRSETPVNLIQCTTNYGCHSIFFLTNEGILKRVPARLEVSTISIEPKTLSPLFFGCDYEQKLSLAGGQEPYHLWIESGNLPSGLTLGSDGTISGYTTQTGNFYIQVRVVDSNCNEGKIEYSIEPICPTLTLSELPNAYKDVEYSQQIQVDNCSALHSYTTYTFSYQGDLPLGLTLSESGLISGKPESSGIYCFIISVIDNRGCRGEKEYHLTVSECLQMMIEPTILPSAVVGDSYDQILAVLGGAGGPYTIYDPGWDIDGYWRSNGKEYSFPPLLSFWLIDGVWHLMGAPIMQGDYYFTAVVQDSYGCKTNNHLALSVCLPAITSANYEFVCDNNIGSYVLRLQGQCLSAKGLRFYSYILQDEKKVALEVVKPVSLTDSEAVIGIPIEWTYSRTIEVWQSVVGTVQTITLSSLFPHFYAFPEGGSVSGGTAVTINGQGFAPGTTISFYINGSWVDQNSVYVSDSQMSLTTTSGPTCEGPVDMKITYPSGCEFVIPSAYIYGYRATLYVNKSRGGAAGGTDLRFFFCPDCPQRDPSDCQVTFKNGDSSQRTYLGYKVYQNCSTSTSMLGGALLDTAYISPTEMTATMPIVPATCATFVASGTIHPPGCPDYYESNFSSSTSPCDYRYHTFNEALTTGELNSDTSGFLTPIDTDSNQPLSWSSNTGENLIPFDRYLSSVSVFPYMGWSVSTFKNLAIVTPYPSSPSDDFPLAYVIDVSNHKVIDTDNDSSNGITGIKMPEFYGIKAPFKSQIYIPSGSWSMYGLVVGAGPSPLAMSPTSKPILNIIDLDSKSPTRYSVINKFINWESIGVDIALAVKPIPNNRAITYAFISEFIWHPGGHNVPPPIECPPCFPNDGKPIPTPAGYRPGLLILDVSVPRNIRKVAEYMIEGSADSGFENFALTLAKNKGPQGTDESNQYIYLVSPGANAVMVYDVSKMDFVRENPDDPESDVITYDVGETPTDLAWAHYEYPPDSNIWYDKVFVTCLDESQVDPCDSIYELNVQDFYAPVVPYPTEESGYCSSSDIPLPTAIDFRADGKYGYVVKGYGGDNLDGGIIHVFDPAEAFNINKWKQIQLLPGTNPTRFDAGAYVNYPEILSIVKKTITDAPETYFDNSAHKQALLNQTKAIETQLNSNASNDAVISKLDAMKKDVNKWVVHQETKDALVLQIDTEKTFVFVKRKKK